MSVIGDYLLSLPDETLDVLFRNGRRASEAEHINRNANEHLSRAYEDYKRTRDKTIDSLDELNKRKMKVMGREIVLFVDIFSKVQNVDLSECKGLSEIKTVEFTEIDYTDMNNEIEDMYNFIKDGMKTYFFGGIVLGSIIMGRKSKISYNNAKANEAASKIEIERLESEEMELDAISKLAKQEDKTIRKLAKLAKKPLELFNEIVSMKTDWFNLRGEAEVDAFPVYMNDLGL